MSNSLKPSNLRVHPSIKSGAGAAYPVLIVVFDEAEDRYILCMMSVIDGTEGSHMNMLYYWHFCTILLASKIREELILSSTSHGASVWCIKVSNLGYTECCESN